MKEFFKKLGRKLTGRKGIGDTMTAVIIIAVVMFNILAYTVTNAFDLYFYSPPKKDFSLSASTEDLFKSALDAEKKVTITFCYPEETLETHSTGSDVLHTARLFREKYPELIELRFVNLLTKTDVTRGSEKNGDRVELKEYTNVICSNKIESTGKECGQKRFCFHSGPFLLYDDGDSIYCYINTGNDKIKKKSLYNIPVLLPEMRCFHIIA